MNDQPPKTATYNTIPSDLRFETDHSAFTAALKKVNSGAASLQFIITRDRLYLRTDYRGLTCQSFVELVSPSSLPDKSMLFLATRSDTLSDLFKNSSEIGILSFSAPEGIEDETNSRSSRSTLLKITSSNYTIVQKVSLFETLEEFEIPSVTVDVASDVLASNIQRILLFCDKTQDRPGTDLNIVEFAHGRGRVFSHPWYYSTEDKKLGDFNLRINHEVATAVARVLRQGYTPCKFGVGDGRFFFLTDGAFCTGRSELMEVRTPDLAKLESQATEIAVSAYELAVAVHNVTAQPPANTRISIAPLSPSHFSLQCVCVDGFAETISGQIEATTDAPKDAEIQGSVPAAHLRKYVKNFERDAVVRIKFIPHALIFRQSSADADYLAILAIQNTAARQ